MSCPHCGYCSHCGRSNKYSYPWWQIQSWPWWQQGQTFTYNAQCQSASAQGGQDMMSQMMGGQNGQNGGCNHQ